MAAKKQDELYRNERIPFQEFLVIANDGENLGLMKKYAALDKARQLGFDLICISPNGKIPVCKMDNFDHYRYKLQQKEKLNRKMQRESLMKEKEINLSYGIAEHDLQTKARRAREFLLDGNKVVVSLRFRGRESSFAEDGIAKVAKFCEQLSDVSTLDRDFSNYRKEGNFFRVYLIPKKSKNQNTGGNQNAKNEN